MNEGYTGGKLDGSPASLADTADVYILSLPSFQWFKASNPSGGPRAFHSCHTNGNNQMILIGGLDYTYTPHPDARPFYVPPDPWTQQLAVFDMTALEWKTHYEAAAQPYAAPDMIKQLYANP